MSNIVDLSTRRPNDADIEVAGFYSPTEAARFARVPRPIVYAWRREGIIVPRMSWINTEGKESVGYTFDALVYLRLLRLLRGERKPLEKAVACLKSLRDQFGPPGRAWADVRIFAQLGDVFVERMGHEGVTAATRHGQGVMEILFGEEFEELRERADALLIPHQFSNTVTMDPEVKLGHPVIRDTTIETQLPYLLFKADHSYRDILGAYPWLNERQLRAAVQYEQFLDAEAA